MLEKIILLYNKLITYLNMNSYQLYLINISKILKIILFLFFRIMTMTLDYGKPNVI